MKLVKFNNKEFGEVRSMVINDEPYFVGKDIAKALGYKKPSNAIATHVDEDDTLKQGIIDKLGRTQQTTMINESGVYSLIFGSKLDSAKAFKHWVTSDILPTLRKSGVVVLDNATDEAIDFQSKFGSYRIRKTFRASKDIRGTYDEFVKLSTDERKHRRLSNKDVVRLDKIIIDEIETKVANNMINMKPSELLAHQELISDIQNDIIHLTNKGIGGEKSVLTKKIRALESQLENQYTDEEDNLIYITIDCHLFSNNYCYTYHNGCMRKSKSYKNWIDKFPVEEVPSKEDYEIYQNIDFSKPIGLDIKYICKPQFDVKNGDKAIIDMIFNRILKVDDNIIECCQSSRVGTVDTYEDGKIMFAIYNL